MHASLVILALSSAFGECDRRARIAGELMILHQSGAPAAEIEELARATLRPEFAANLVGRVLVAETSDQASVRELAAFHFAATVYAECWTTSALF